MSEYRKDTELLADILEAIRRIFSYTHGISEQAYYEDDKSQDAVVCNDVVRMTKSRITDPVHFMIRVIPRERVDEGALCYFYKNDKEFRRYGLNRCLPGGF